MATTRVSRDQQIKQTTGNVFVTNASDGTMQDTSVTANRAVATDSNGLPVASTSTDAQLNYLQGLVSLTIGDIIDVSSSGNLQDASIASADLFLRTGSVAATGAFNLNSHQIHNVTDPTSAQDAATKNYVDSLQNGLSWKTSVEAATTTNLATTFPGGYTYFNGLGNNGIGATLTENTPTDGAFIIDGYTASVNDRILIKNETGSPNAAYNGIYVVIAIGNGSSIPWVLERSLDQDTPAEFPAAAVISQNGTVNADLGFVCTTKAPVTIGTTHIVWVTFTSSVVSYFAGNGLDLSGSTFSISTDNSLTANAGNSTPSLVVKEDPAGAIITNVAGIAIQLESSNPTLQISTNQLGVKLDGSRAITTGASGIGVNVDNSTIDISSNAIEVKSGGITNTQISASAAIDFSKLASLTSAHILLGNASNVATDTAVSGDVTISNTGVVSIANGISNHLITRETPSGTINGSNPTFILAFTPSPVGSEQIYLNGLLQQAGAGADYTISGATITFNVAPEGGSRLLAIYWK